LITAETLSPTFSMSSSTASLVIDDVTVSPEANSIFTCAVVDPFVTATTFPGRILRALSFIFAFPFLTATVVVKPNFFIAHGGSIQAALAVTSLR